MIFTHICLYVNKWSTYNVRDTKNPPCDEVLGTLLFFARAIDSALLTAIGELATEQLQATTTTLNKLSQLLNNWAAHPDATVRFTASDMILAVESDASNLSVVKGRSRAAGYFLTNKPKTPDGPFKPNGAVHILCHTMREVLSSATEAELGALFHNGKEACPLRIALEEMGLPQPATPMSTDNNTASRITTDTVKQNNPKQSTCVFIGSAIVFANANFTFIGAKARQNVRTTSPNIIRHCIIRPFVPHTYTLPQILHRTTLNVYPTRHLHLLLRQSPLPIRSLSILAPLVRVCCYPWGTRNFIITVSQNTTS